MPIIIVSNEMVTIPSGESCTSVLALNGAKLYIILCSLLSFINSPNRRV